MKLRSLFFGALACITMASCSSDDDSTAAESKGKSYVSVRLTMPGNTTRAWDDTNADSNFEDAPESELKVKEAMFFFFNEFDEGCANATIISGKDLTWTDGTANTVDEKSNAVIVIDTRKDPSKPNPFETPSKITCVLNPTPAIKALQNSQVDLSDLQAKIESYNFDKAPFMMSTSVYVNGGKVIATTDISNNVFDNTDDAKASPVSIPVEKVVAKVNTVYSKTKSENFPLYINKEAAPKTLYVKLTKGWWIDNTRTEADLLKKVSTSYPETGVSNTNWWNDATNSRSYWANTADYTDDKFLHYKFSDATGADKFCLEHTSVQNYNPDSAKMTKVVFQGYIRDAATGDAVDLIKYSGFHYTGEGLKNFIAQQGVVRKFYKKKDSESTYTQLNASDIEYIWNEDGNILNYKSISGDVTPLKDYHVMVSLKANNEYKYYTSVDEEPTPLNPTATTAAAIAQEWQSRFGELKYWKNGQTYFFAEITHNDASSFAKYGVVRNHLYRMTVNSLKGFGTPVPNEDKTIIPERPVDDKESYISAEIKILKYRIVEQSVDLH